MAKFHFVLKTSQSTSLSHGDELEQFEIRCHAQNRRRAAKRSPPSKTRSTSKKVRPQTTSERDIQHTSISVASDHRSASLYPAATYTASVWTRSFSHVATPRERCHPLSYITNNSFDPFRCTTLAQDSTTFHIFQFMCSNFSDVNSRAEALGVPSLTSAVVFRHKTALEKRIQLCLSNETVMSTTLAFASAAMGWRVGLRYNDRPPEYFIQNAYTAMRRRLDETEPVDTTLVLCIYALCMSETWTKNYKAAKTHLGMIAGMTERAGGVARLGPYLMESVILGSKFLAIFSNSTPILPLNWEPPNWSPDRMLQVRLSLSPSIARCGQTFSQVDHVVIITQDLRDIIDDMALLWQIQHWVWSQPEPDSNDELWLFLKTQAVSHRLLHLRYGHGINETLKVALLLWLLSVTDYMGARVSAIETLGLLKQAEQAIPVDTFDLLEVRFWINSLGTMIALPAAASANFRFHFSDGDCQEYADFFTKNTAILARRLGLTTDRVAYQKFLQGYFYMESRQGLALSRLMEAVSSLETTSDLDLGLLG